jgi:hypothetical protein
LKKKSAKLQKNLHFAYYVYTGTAVKSENNLKYFQQIIYFQPVPIGTVASRPNILKNNSKPALEKSCWAGKIGGRPAAIFGQKRPKTGWKKYFMKNLCFS